MSIALRQYRAIGALCAAVLLGAATMGFSAAAHAPTPSDTSVNLAAIVAAWPDTYTVDGTKSEPGYVEHITSTRAGDRFALRIVLEAQGTDPGGSSSAEVIVSADGSVSWVSGCPGEPCTADPAVRGFLAAASLLSAQREGRLPSTGVVRQLGSNAVVCVSDAELFPVSAATSLARLDPCFSLETGAVLGHYSTANAAFVGPTMSPASIAESIRPDSGLLPVPPE